MSGFLMVVPPLAGHVNPTVAVGGSCSGAGNDVHGPVIPSSSGPAPGNCRLWPAGGDFSAEDMVGARARWLNLRAFAALAALWDEVLIPLGAAMWTRRGRGRRYAPDVGRRRQRPWRGRWSLAGMASRGDIASTSPSSPAPMPPCRRSRAGWRSGWRPSSVVRGKGAATYRFSEHLVLSYTVPELAGPVQVPCSLRSSAPPSGTGRRGALPWDWLNPAGSSWLPPSAPTTRRRGSLIVCWSMPPGPP